MTKKKEEQIQQVESMKDDLVDNLILDLNKSLGKKDEPLAITLESDTVASIKTWIPSGDPGIDSIIGRGWPCGRIVELFGPESSGKTTVALTAIRECQKMNGVAVFLDTENALSRERAKDIGVDLRKMIYINPGTMEEVFKVTDQIIDSVRAKNTERPVIIVWDSVAATKTQAELEGDYDQSHVGVAARVMSQSLKKITEKIAKNNILFMCINQTRDKVGVMYGSSETTPGGKALKFYASVRLSVRKIGQHKEGNEVVGIKCKAKCEKNKVSPPFQETEFVILFDKENAGIDTYGALLDRGHKVLFGGTPGWYTMPNGKKMRKNEAREYLKNNPDEYQKLYDTLQSMEV